MTGMLVKVIRDGAAGLSIGEDFYIKPLREGEVFKLNKMLTVEVETFEGERLEVRADALARIKETETINNTFNNTKE